MQTIFCTECGSKNEYSGKKPNFCSSCGFSFGGQAVTKPAPQYTKKRPVKKAQPKASPVEISEDETDIDYVPSISSLSYEVTSGGNIVHKFEDIVDAPKEEKEK